MSRNRHGRARLRQQAVLACACVLLATPVRLVAEDSLPTGEASENDGVDAGSREADAEADRDVEEMLVLGTRRAAMDVLAGASTSRVDTDERLIEGAQIDDILAELPGVQIRRFGGIGERFEISIRGSRPEQVPVFLDGVRVDNSLTGKTDLSTLCLDVLQEIQVTRGAGAARAGSGAIGGVVNLVSKKDVDETPETRLRAAAGSFESFEGSLRHARKIGAWDTSLSYCGFHTEGDFDFQRARQFVGGVPTGSAEIETRINNEALRQTGLAQLGRDIGRGRVHVTQLATYLDRGAPGLESNQRPNSEERDLSTLTSLNLEHPIDALPSGHFASVLAHRFERNEFEDDPYTLASEPIDADTRVNDSVARTSLGFATDLFGGRQIFSVLAEGRFDHRQSNEAQSRSRAGGAARIEMQASWFDDRLSISPSLRVERFDGLDTEWIPGVTARVEPIDWLEIRGAFARSYRAPSFQELYLPDKGFERGNPNLKPEEAWSGEIGVTLRSPFDAAWLDAKVEATYFAGEIENAIAFLLISPSVLAPVNTGRSETRGYELSVRWSPHPWIRATGTRTVTNAELESTGARVAGVAVSQTDGRIELGPRDRWKLVGEVHYTGRLPVSANEAAVLPSRTSFDASASIDLTKFPLLRLERFGKSLWLSVRGRNLSNAALRDARSFPRPGRNFSIALESVF